MNKQPAVIIVARSVWLTLFFHQVLTILRHGARIDAADKQWHLTSPTPYDPPLTYGGWRQSHALGARIATILQKREIGEDSQPRNGILKHPSISSLEESDHNDNKYIVQGRQRAQQRRHRVILHTSPFLRCVQSSIAISAGLAEAQASMKPEGPINAKPQNPHATHPLHSGSPHIRAMEGWNSPQLTAISEPEEFEEEHFQNDQIRPGQGPKPLLRTDAFLGEWLSPSYFEDITHPPDSVMMVAGAKASLLREKSSTSELRVSSTEKPPVGNFPGGWGGGTSNLNQNVNDDTDGPFTRLSGLNRNLPRLNRSSSHSSAGSLAHRSSQRHHSELENIASSNTDGYVSPTPSYAVSPVGPIPPGYVAHAKDACVDVDYQWDSMRPPHEWGDGGQFGEEWSSMHKRFRRGLQQMILWYGQSDSEKSTPGGREALEFQNLDCKEEDDTDLVLVLVTHSAGCNALMGALTNQPVLLDAGMASLTMAVRRPDVDNRTAGSPEPLSPGSRRRRSSIDLGISEHYEVKIMASTEHLRPGNVSISHRSSSASLYHLTPRYRSSSLASTSSALSAADGGSSSDSDSGQASSGGLNRSFTAAAPRSNGLWSKPEAVAPTGLWGSSVNPQPEAPLVQNPAHNISPLRESTKANKAIPFEQAAGETLEENHRPESGGLWGAPPLPSPGDREKGPKRRWTHSEHR